MPWNKDGSRKTHLYKRSGFRMAGWSAFTKEIRLEGERNIKKKSTNKKLERVKIQPKKIKQVIKQIKKQEPKKLFKEADYLEKRKTYEYDPKKRLL